MSVTATTFAALAERLAETNSPAPLVMDIREPDEWAAGHLAAAVSLPMSTVPAHVEEIPNGQQVWVYCASGNRAQRVCDFLTQTRPDLHIMWVKDIFPTVSQAQSLGLTMES